jgi:hypothetical protein
MITKKRFSENLIIMCATTILIFAFAANCISKELDAGSVWKITETSKLSNLTIGKGAVIKAPEGCEVTMTVDGVEVGIEPGIYKGDIVLTVTKEIQNPVMMGAGPSEADNRGSSGGAGGAPGGSGGSAPGGVPAGAGGDAGAAYVGVRAAIYVDGGVYSPEKSVAAAVMKGTVTNSSAKDVSISSKGKDFNGIIVTGDSAYLISNLKINFNGGDQGNNGAAITSGGKANVTINKASIFSKGVQWAAIIVGGNSTMHINDSDIEAQDGTLQEKFAKMEDSNSMEVPWVLGFIGNNRATNVVESGTAYYNNTHIKTQRWGCLSTDAVKSVKLYATNCRLEAVESGYGAYSDGAYDSFSKCTFDVKDYGLIMTGGTGIFTDGCVVNSGRFGVMFHGAGNLTIDKGCVFNTKRAVIQVKSASPTIVVDNSKLSSESGIILEAIVNDDPWKVGGMPGGGPGGPAADRGGMPKSAGGSTDATATFKNMTMKGDIVSSMTRERDVIINFEKTTITGAITTATSRAQSDIDGVKLTKKYYYYIGAVKNTYCATDEKHGMKVSLDGKSRWVVNQNSYLTSLILSDGAVIAAPDGYRLTMTVNGVEKEIKAGSYSGKIALTVIKS